MRKNWPDGMQCGVALSFDLDAETFWFEVGKILDAEFDESADIAEFLLRNKLFEGSTQSYRKLSYRILNCLWNCIFDKNSGAAKWSSRVYLHFIIMLMAVWCSCYNHMLSAWKMEEKSVGVENENKRNVLEYVGGVRC